MEIRELDEADDVRAVYAAVLPDSPTARSSRSDRQQFVADPATFLLGAFVSERPVGLAWGIQMRSPSARLTTYLHELEVHEGWRRKGIGGALVRAAMELGSARGSTKFWLSTGGHNEGAQALYASLKGDRKALGDVNYWWDLA